MTRFLAILLFTYGLAISTEDIYKNSWAVIIGINEYEYVDKLNYAVQDAEAIKNLLISNFNFPQENVIMLIDNDATLDNIRTKLFDIAISVSEDDRLLVYFAGHGQTYEKKDGGELGYLIPVDGEIDNIFATCLPMDDIKRVSSITSAKHVLFLMDACYGGLLAAGARSLNKTTPGYINKITRDNARQIITAGGKGEQVIEKSEWGHSAFAKNILQGLKTGIADEDSDGFITADELGSFLKKRVTIDSDNSQTPVKRRFGSDEGEFVFINSIDPFDIGSMIGSKSKIVPTSIAIIDFEGIGVSIDVARVLTQRLASEIISLNVYQIFERSKVDQVIKEQKFQHSGGVDAAIAVEIGKLAGVEQMVIGTVSKIGKTYSVDSRMIDVESGKSVISAEYSTQNSIDDVTTKGMESISYQLCNMEVPKPPPPSLFARMYKSRGKIFVACLTLLIGWGLMPA